MPKESVYQSKLIKRIQNILPNCYILKNDPAETQGMPDLLILHNNQWAMLEVKKDRSAEIQPNQEYYLDMFGAMSFASFIFPEIEADVLYQLQEHFGV